MAIGAKDVFGKDKIADKTARSGVTRPRPGLSDYIAGEAGDFSGSFYPYLPQDLIGGVIPHIPGTEDSAVWNAASQACSIDVGVRCCSTATANFHCR